MGLKLDNMKHLLLPKEDRALLQKLLSYYKNVLADVPDTNDLYTVITYLADHYVEQGVCKSSRRLFGIHLYFTWWKDVFRPINSLYWYTPPASANNINEAKQALQYRIDIMQKLLNMNFFQLLILKIKGREKS